MSLTQALPEEKRNTNELEKGRAARTATDVHREKARSAQKQPSLRPMQGESNFGDSSGPIFSLYSKIAKEEDDEKVERWQKDADGILIFTGLFSVSVAAFLAVTVQDLRPNAQDTSAFYLGNIYQILADPNVTAPHISTPYPVTKPPPFSPPRSAVLVNSLWFLSFVISLTCALLATSLQQWARRYVRATQPARCSPEKRARLRAFFAGGVDKMHLPWVVEVLPILLHASLFLFFAGLIIFLLCINHCVYLTVAWWIGLFSMLYGCITFMPIFWPDSPYYTPLSPPVSFISALVLSAIVVVIHILHHCSLAVAVLYSVLRRCFNVAWVFMRSFSGQEQHRKLRDRPHGEVKEKWFTPARDRFLKPFSHTTGVLSHRANLIRNSRMAAEEITSKRSSMIDLSILHWIIGALGEDDTLELFFGAIPGFFNSQMVEGLKGHLTDGFRSKFAESWGGFLARSLLSNSVNEVTKNRRLAICMSSIKDICDDNNLSKLFSELSSLRFDQITPSSQAMQLLAPWFPSSDVPTNPTSELARYTLAKMLPYVRERDGRWISLARDVYGLSEQDLHSYIDQGDDSVMLAILIHVARQVIHIEPWKWEILSSISKFDIKSTLSGLQIEFCALWNEIVEKANTESLDTGSNPFLILRGIRHLYIDLHRGTDSAPTYFDVSTDDLATFLFDPSSYPLCQVDSHRPGSIVSSPIQLHPHHAIPHRSRSKNQPSHVNNTGAQQAEEANFIPGLTSPIHAAPHSQGFTSLSRNTVPEPIAPWANAVAPHSPIHQIIEVVARDPELFISRGAHLSCRLSLPGAANLIVTITHVRRHLGRRTRDIPMKEMGQTSQTRHTTLLTLPPPDIGPHAIAPSPAPHPPSLSGKEGDFLDTSNPIASALTSPHRLDSSMQQGIEDIAVPHSASDVTQILSADNQSLQFIPYVSPAIQTSEEATDISLTAVSDFLSSPSMIHALRSGSVPGGLPSESSVESAAVRPHRVSHPPGSPPSSLATFHINIDPRMSSGLDAHVTTSSCAPSMQANSLDSIHPIPVVDSRQEIRSVPSTPDIVEHTSVHGSHQDDRSGLLR